MKIMCSAVSDEMTTFGLDMGHEKAINRPCRLTQKPSDGHCM